MTRPSGTLAAASMLLALLVHVEFAQVQQGGRNGAPGLPGARNGAPPPAGRAGGPPAAAALLLEPPPKPVTANTKPVLSCGSLATLTLPDTTIESARIDPN